MFANKRAAENYGSSVTSARALDPTPLSTFFSSYQAAGVVLEGHVAVLPHQGLVERRHELGPALRGALLLPELVPQDLGRAHGVEVGLLRGPLSPQGALLICRAVLVVLRLLQDGQWLPLLVRRRLLVVTVRLALGPAAAGALTTTLAATSLAAALAALALGLVVARGPLPLGLVHSASVWRRRHTILGKIRRAEKKPNFDGPVVRS
jgi:hypothetical protein